jgi:hypothetical protein
LNEIGAGAAVAEAFAGGFDAEALADGTVAEAAGDAVVEEVEVAVLEFDDFTAINADEVVVVGVGGEVGVVGGLAVAQFDFVDEICFDEEGKGSVNGGTGCLGPDGPEAIKKFIGREMFFRGEDDFENFIPLCSLSEALFLDEAI